MRTTPTRTAVLLATSVIVAALGSLLLDGGRPARAAPLEDLTQLRSADPVERADALRGLLQVEPAELHAEARRLKAPLERLFRKDEDPAVRGLAARVLARALGADAVDTLMDAFATETDPVVERALLRAVAELPAGVALPAVSNAAFDESDERRSALAAEALGMVRDGAGSSELLGLLATARGWATLTGACLALGRVPDLRVPPALVQRLRHPDAAVRSAATESLVRLCGVDKGSNPNDWEHWWDEVGADFEFPGGLEGADDDEQSGAEVRGKTSDDHTAPGRNTHSRFFGIELTGKRVAFCVDYSQSMWGKRRDKAQAELVAAVKGLPSDHTFAVILFNEPVWWFRDRVLPARPQEKLDLERYLPTQKTRKYTNIHGALMRGLGLLGEGPDAVPSAPGLPPPGLDELVLLSDGVPNRGKYKDTERILASVRELNKGRVVIHTVSLGDEEHDLLPRIAEENGGKYVEHPFPK